MEHTMDSDRSHQGLIARVLLVAGIAMAALGLSAGTADAVPPGGPYTWCPGDPPVETGNKRINPVIWDETICHEYWFVYHGQGNVAQNIWDGPDPPAPPPTIPFTPLPPLPPGLCWPIGSFIPVPIACP